MWKYVVFWVLASVGSGPSPQPDQWGRVSGMVAAVAYVSRDTMQKVFPDRASAMEFYKQTTAQIDPTSMGFGGDGEIVGARLDSLYIPRGFKQ